MSLATQSDPVPRDTPQSLALELLAIHGEHMRREKRNRIKLMRAARDQGLTYAAIADALGINKDAVRMALKRAGEAR